MKKHRLRIGILIGGEIALPWINILVAWDKMLSKKFTLDLITNVDVPEYIRNNYNVYNYISPLENKITTEELHLGGISLNVSYFKLFVNNTRFIYRKIKDFINCYRYTKMKRPDILLNVGMLQTYGLIIAIVGKLFKVYTIAYNLGDLYDRWKIENQLPRRISHFIKFNIPGSLCYRLVDKIIFQGPILANKAIRRGIKREKTVIIPQPTDPENFFITDNREYYKKKIGVEINKLMILFVGRLEYRKGFYTILPIIDAVIKNRDDIIFYFVGKGPYAEMLEKYDKNYVNLVGSKLPYQIYDYYKSADLFILPSMSEGLPLVILEAMFCGVPIIASGAGDIPSYCSNIFNLPQEYINYILNEKWEADPIPNELKWQEIKERYILLFNTVSAN